MTRVFALLLFAVSAFGQTFDVASIKPSDPSSHGMNIGISPSGSFRATGVTVFSLIQQAYDVPGFQISGGPGWITTDRYDILTKNESAGPTQADLIKMNDSQRNDFRAAMMARLRALLEDRFQLKTHRETKEMQVYGLGLAKGGPKLQPMQPGGRDSSLSVSRGNEANMHVTAKGLPIANLVKYLSDQSGRRVMDETGLTGKYDFQLVFAPDLGEIEGPSLFTALQEQLGLKLESKKGPVDVIVIDGVEKPSEN